MSERKKINFTEIFQDYMFWKQFRSSINRITYAKFGDTLNSGNENRKE